MSISFGKYFDDQRDRIVSAMQNKNTQLNNEWRERYNERERQEKEERMKKELQEYSEKMIEISQECKMFYKNKFECRMFNPIDDNYFSREIRKNDETKENNNRV